MKEFLAKLKELQGNSGQKLLVLSIGSAVPTGEDVTAERRAAADSQTCPEFAKQAASLGVNVVVLNIDPQFRAENPLDTRLSTKNLAVFKYGLSCRELNAELIGALKDYIQQSRNNKFVLATYISPFPGLILAKKYSNLRGEESDNPLSFLCDVFDDEQVKIISGYCTNFPCCLLTKTAIARIKQGVDYEDGPLVRILNKWSLKTQITVMESLLKLDYPDFDFSRHYFPNIASLVAKDLGIMPVEQKFQDSKDKAPRP